LSLKCSGNIGEGNSRKLRGFWIFVVLSETEAVPLFFISIYVSISHTSGVLTLLLAAGWVPLPKSLFSKRV